MVSTPSPGRRRLLPALHLAILLAVTVLALLPRPTLAQQTTAPPRIYQPPSYYLYHGCYNETTELDGVKARALGGPGDVRPGAMTVQACLDFCRTGSTAYKFAGLEFSRECWCGSHLNTLSVKLPDSECNTACDGDGSIVCGGALKLSVYVSAARPSSAAASNLVLIIAAALVAGVSF